jgi:hypothetical protein
VTRVSLLTFVAAGGSQSWFVLSSGINTSSTEPATLCCGHSPAHMSHQACVWMLWCACYWVLTPGTLHGIFVGQGLPLSLATRPAECKQQQGGSTAMLHTPLCMYRPLIHGYRRPFVHAASADHQPAHTHLRTLVAGGGSRLGVTAPTPVRTKHDGEGVVVYPVS